MDFLTKPILEGLPLEFRPWEMLYIIAIILILRFTLDKLLYQPVLGVLAERAKRIEEGRKAQLGSDSELAAKEREIEERLTAARVEALSKLDSARAEAGEKRSVAVDAARDTAAKTLADAEAALEKAQAEVGRELEAGQEGLARSIASRLLGRGVA
ncbi:MAG: ATP synthase F0 subunit B [Acidobacteriota bacterium]